MGRKQAAERPLDHIGFVFQGWSSALSSIGFKDHATLTELGSVMWPALGKALEPSFYFTVMRVFATLAGKKLW